MKQQEETCKKFAIWLANERWIKTKSDYSWLNSSTYESKTIDELYQLFIDTL